MSDQTQCPNCGAYKVNNVSTRQVNPKNGKETPPTGAGCLFVGAPLIGAFVEFQMFTIAIESGEKMLHLILLIGVLILAVFFSFSFSLQEKAWSIGIITTALYVVTSGTG
jgi:hypothetical protein